MPPDGRAYAGSSAAERDQARRQAMIDAARTIIAEHGVAAVTAEQVCRVAGLTKRYFYAAYESRDALLNECAENLFSSMLVDVTKALGAQGDINSDTPSPEQRIHQAVRATVHILASDPASARLYRECSAFPHLRELQQKAIREFTSTLVDGVLPLRGDASPDRRNLAVRIVIAGATEVVIAWFSGDIIADESTITASIIETVQAVSAAL